MLPSPHWAAGGDVNEGKRDRIHLAASTDMMGEVNVNDARAAIRSWADEIVKASGMEIAYGDGPLMSSDLLFDQVSRGAVDAFAINVLEYMRLAPYIDPNLLLIDKAYAPGGLEYLLVVNDESGIKSLANLRGRQLALINSPEMCLAPVWLETVLAASNLGSMEAFFRGITRVAKLSRAVLPVFFRQMDACLVTRRGFSLMCEMNPQLARKLRVILISPKLVPIVFAFHKDLPADRKNKLKDALVALPATAVGKQLMTLFQSDGMFVSNDSIVKGSVELVKASQRIKTRVARAQVTQP